MVKWSLLIVFIFLAVMLRRKHKRNEDEFLTNLKKAVANGTVTLTATQREGKKLFINVNGYIDDKKVNITIAKTPNVRGVTVLEFEPINSVGRSVSEWMYIEGVRKYMRINPNAKAPAEDPSSFPNVHWPETAMVYDKENVLTEVSNKALAKHITSEKDESHVQ